MKTIFQNQKFISRGVANTIPLFLQIIMWELIKNVPVDCDYLQVFSLSSKSGKQKITHTQEVPEYKKEYIFNTGTAISAKIFVIDDKTHSTMLLAEEY